MVNYWIHLKGHNKSHRVKKVLQTVGKRKRFKKIVLGGLGIIELEHLKYMTKNLIRQYCGL